VSADEIKPTNDRERGGAPAPRPRSTAARVGRIIAWTVGGLLVLSIVAVLGFWWYSTTSDFNHRVANKLIAVLEDSTGGRAEINNLHFSLRHLALEVDGLVIHGTEAPGEAPYLAIDKLRVRVKLMNFFSHATGSGSNSHIGLNLLRVERPQFHLIIDKNGKTNQPVPKHPSTSNESLQDTLLDLKAAKMELLDGVALLNDKAVPFDATARDLNLNVHYISSTDRYGITLDLNDLRTRMKTEPEAQSKLHAEAELGRDMAQLTKFTFDTGANSQLRGSATVNHFAQPEWQAALDGNLALKQISMLSAVEGLEAGTVDIVLRGHSCEVAPAEAQKRPSFTRRFHLRKPEKPATVPLPPDPECKAGYLLVGNAKVHNASYVTEYVRLNGVNGGADLHITPTQLLFTALTGYLPGGGSAAGELRIENWLGEVPSNAPTKSPTAVGAVTTANKTAESVGAAPPAKTAPKVTPVPAHAYLVATVNAIPLRTIMDVTAKKEYADLGFDTSITGPLKVEWGGPATEIADTVVVDADLKLRPTGRPWPRGRANIPVSGETVAHYDGKREVVEIQRAALQTPQSSTHASGVLGVNKGDPLTNLRVDTSIRDLGEFDQLLQTLGFEANGKKGSAAIPVVLHGAANFHGTAAGRAANLDVKGHLEGSSIEVKLGTQLDTQIDSIVADAEYQPQTGLAVASSTIKRNTAVLNVSGTMKPRRVVSRRGAVSYVWDNGAAVNASMQLANADIPDLLQIAGQQGKYPITGTISINAKASGTLAAPNGSGQITLTKGVAYGEPYDLVQVNGALQGQQIEATRALVSLHGMQITGNGGYNMQTKQLHGHVEGRNLVLSKFVTVQKARPNADGTLTIVADANGTVEQPGLRANVTLTKVVVDSKPIGELSAEVHSEGSLLRYTAQSTLIGAKIDASGQTQLTGNYDTQARLTLSGVDIGNAVTTFSPTSSLKAQSAIGGVITVNGPLKTPKVLSGTAEINNFDVKLQGIELTSAGPLRASLQNGLLTLDNVHIMGQDTDLQAAGTVQAFGSTNPNGGNIAIHANGSISMALAHTLDPDLLSSGKVQFTVTAGGQLKKPDLSGRVFVQNVNLAMDGIPNGLSNLNGTLVFSQDRLQVENLVGTTGGGQVNMGGFITMKNGLFADLSASGNGVRVRLYGLSTTANINLRLQGGPDNLLLGGNVLITRFGVGPDVDFAAFSSAGGVSAPPDPTSVASKISMNVRVQSSPQMDFQNSYAKLAGTVDLTVRGTVAEPAILGRIRITYGQATFAGTTYELQRGDIYFSNPVRIDPTVDIDATARVENYDITVGLQGTMSNLKPTYRSEPPLTQTDIFQLLALGRTQEEASINTQQQTQQGEDPTTSALLGGALNATVSNRVGKLFGGGTVKIDPAFMGTLGNSSARITVQKQLSRQLSVTYATNVNSTAQPLLQGQYDLTPNVSLVVTRDETGVFSIVYRIRQRYR
jgi:translocation and assembly module TamB